MNFPSELPIARYRFRVKAVDNLYFPSYSGSVLRGSFGAALRRVSCMTKQKTCAGCPLRMSCSYIHIFEAPAPEQHSLQKFSNIPNSYVIEPNFLNAKYINAEDGWSFDMVLVGKTLQQLSLIIYAWDLCLSNGLGKQRSKQLLQSVALVHDSVSPVIWERGYSEINSHINFLQIPSIADSIDSVVLDFKTPLRLQNQGSAVWIDNLTPKLLLAALARRVSLLMEFHADYKDLYKMIPRLLDQASCLQQEKNLKWYDWVRYSSRQKQTMILGGAIGAWRLDGDLAEIYPWLYLGSFLHVGKNTIMGQGYYVLSLLSD